MSYDVSYDDYRAKVSDLRNLLTERSAYEQLAEESAELGQAALKYIRTMNPQDNPTPVHPVDAYANLVEEASDVFLVLRVVGVEIDMNLMIEKADRWIKRLDTSKHAKREAVSTWETE